MPVVCSFEQYQDLKAQAKHRCGKLTTNCSATANELKKDIARNAMSYSEYPQGIVFFVDEGNYKRVIYYLSLDQPVPDMRQDKAVCIEELDSCNRKEQFLAHLAALLGQAGWIMEAKNVYVEKDFANDRDALLQQAAESRRKLAAEGLTLCDCTKEQRDSVLSLWALHLKDTDVPADHLNFLNDEEQHVLCITDSAGLVCCVNWWCARGRNCEIRHTVTHPDYYRRGLGEAMLLATMADAIGHDCTKAFTYIDEKNYPSLALFGKVGLQPNGKTTTQFILKGADDGRNA